MATTGAAQTQQNPVQRMSRQIDLIPQMTPQGSDPAQLDVAEIGEPNRVARRQDDEPAVAARLRIVAQPAIERGDQFEREALLTRHLLRKKAAVDIKLQHDEPSSSRKRGAELMEVRAPSSAAGRSPRPRRSPSRPGFREGLADRDQGVRADVEPTLDENGQGDRDEACCERRSARRADDSELWDEQQVQDELSRDGGGPHRRAAVLVAGHRHQVDTGPVPTLTMWPRMRIERAR